MLLLVSLNKIKKNTNSFKSYRLHRLTDTVDSKDASMVVRRNRQLKRAEEEEVEEMNNSSAPAPTRMRLGFFFDGGRPRLRKNREKLECGKYGCNDIMACVKIVHLPKYICNEDRTGKKNNGSNNWKKRIAETKWMAYLAKFN